MGKQAEENGARRRQRGSFTPEFKAEVIALVHRGRAVAAGDLSRARPE
jgi:transposase-like protein